MPGNTESILYDTNGDPLAVDDGVAIPAGTPMILSGGSDGTNSRYIKVDSSGNQILVGAGTAGSPVGGLITIQGDSSGTPLPISGSVTISSGTITVSGTITADQGAPNSVGNGWPVKITDGTNILGTNSNPVRIDPTGTTTQPISGTVTANAGTGNFAVVQATAALLNATVTANGNFNNASVSATAAAPPASATYIGGSVTTASPTYTNGNMNALSLTTAGALRIDGSAVTQPISGTVTANAGTGTFSISGTVTSNQGTSPWVNNITQFGGSNVVTGTGTGGAGIPRVTVSNDSNILATQSGTWTVAQGTAAALSGKWPVQITDGTNTMPTGDAVGRAIFEKITDGTNTAAVKAASTAAAASDPSLVTAFSPNSPLPTGSNTIGAVTQASGPWTENLTQIAGSSVSTAATGVQKVGVVGNAGASTDATLAAGTAPTNGFGQLAQYNTSQPAPTNTQTVSAQSDQSGNLLQFPGVQTKTGAVWNSSTTINTLQFPTGTATVGAPLGSLSVLVQLNQTSTFSAGAVTFQGTYDGTNWVTIPTAQILHPQTLVSLSNPYTFVASTNQPFLIQLQGFQQVRMNLTSTITGTGTVTPFWTILSNPPTQAITTLSGGYGGQIEGRAADGAVPVGNPVLVGGYDGTNTQTILTDTSGRIVIAPSGASTTSGFSFGDVALSSITTSVVRRTTYNEQTTNAQRSIASANANDTSAGTGARQVKITYYDSTGAGPFTETVTLNGTTAVATSNTNICFIEEMSVVSVGSGGVNAGIITLFVNNSGGGGTIGTIAASDNTTYWAHHYVPTGKTNFITSLSVVVNGGGALFFVRAQTIGVSTAPNVQISDYVRSATQSGTSTRVYGTAIQTVGPARLLMYVTTEANTSLTYRGAFDYYDE